MARTLGGVLFGGYADCDGLAKCLCLETSLTITRTEEMEVRDGMLFGQHGKRDSDRLVKYRCLETSGPSHTPRRRRCVVACSLGSMANVTVT
eukprot:693359-Pelagomonas_calceolata.AAC.1